MAEALADNVRQLRPGKAKGAKSTGGRKSPDRLKPRPGESTPAKGAHPTDEEVRRNTQDRLIALHSQHRAIDNKLVIAQEAVSELKTQKNAVRGAIQNSCVPLAIYEELHKKLSKKTTRSDNELYESQRALAFEAFGLPVGPRPELPFSKTPEAARPALYWENVGFAVGMDGKDFLDPQRDGVPPENLQDYMRGGQRATEQIGRGLKLLAKDPKPEAAVQPPAMVGETADQAQAREDARTGAEEPAATQPDWSAFSSNPDVWTDHQRQVFDTWYESLGDEEVTILHPGVEIAFDARMVEEEQAPLDAQRKEDAAAFED